MRTCSRVRAASLRSAVFVSASGVMAGCFPVVATHYEVGGHGTISTQGPCSMNVVRYLVVPLPHNNSMDIQAISSRESNALGPRDGYACR